MSNSIAVARALQLSAALDEGTGTKMWGCCFRNAKRKPELQKERVNFQLIQNILLKDNSLPTFRLSLERENTLNVWIFLELGLLAFCSSWVTWLVVQGEGLVPTRGVKTKSNILLAKNYEAIEGCEEAESGVATTRSPERSGLIVTRWKI